MITTRYALIIVLAAAVNLAPMVRAQSGQYRVGGLSDQAIQGESEVLFFLSPSGGTVEVEDSRVTTVRLVIRNSNDEVLFDSELVAGTTVDFDVYVLNSRENEQEAFQYAISGWDRWSERVGTQRGWIRLSITDAGYGQFLRAISTGLSPKEKERKREGERQGCFMKGRTKAGACDPRVPRIPP